MPVYTRTGDDGTTGLYGGKRFSKTDLVFYAIGSLDELTSFIGLTSSFIKNKEDKKILTKIQKNIYLIMSNLSGGKIDVDFLSLEIKELEKNIDFMEISLPKLKKFIIPQSGVDSGLFHVCRTVCRRAERNVLKYFQNKNIKKEKEIVSYLNRLSDYFFVMARQYRQGKEIVL